MDKNLSSPFFSYRQILTYRGCVCTKCQVLHFRPDRTQGYYATIYRNQEYDQPYVTWGAIHPYNGYKYGESFAAQKFFSDFTDFHVSKMPLHVVRRPTIQTH